jgi:hypothetical protein
MFPVCSGCSARLIRNLFSRPKIVPKEYIQEASCYVTLPWFFCRLVPVLPTKMELRLTRQFRIREVLGSNSDYGESITTHVIGPTRISWVSQEKFWDITWNGPDCFERNPSRLISYSRHPVIFHCTLNNFTVAYKDAKSWNKQQSSIAQVRSLFICFIHEMHQMNEKCGSCVCANNSFPRLINGIRLIWYRGSLHYKLLAEFQLSLYRANTALQ